MTTSLETGTDPTLTSSIPAGYEKRLMVAAGRASRELGRQDRRAPRGRVSPTRA